MVRRRKRIEADLMLVILERVVSCGRLVRHAEYFRSKLGWPFWALTLFVQRVGGAATGLVGSGPSPGAELSHDFL